MRYLILDGGGQQGAFEWGAMSELKQREINYKYFDCYICTSAGAFNAAYFLTEQFEEGKRIWLEHLPNGFWKFFVNDTNFLKKTLSQTEKLNCDLIKQRKQKILISVYNQSKNCQEFIELNSQENIISALLAGCSMPFFSGPFNYKSQKYYDGGLLEQPAVSKVFELANANTEIWAILTKPTGFRLLPLYWKLLSYLFFYTKNLSQTIANCPKLCNNAYSLLENFPSKITIVRPEKELPIGIRSTNEKLVEETFMLGESAVQNIQIL